MRCRNCNMKSCRLYAVVAVMVLLILPASELAHGNSGRDLGPIHARVAKQVQHELMMLPYYNAFDNLVFEIQGVDTVVLSGQVTRPALKSDAENAVKLLESVGKIVNEIDVLPLSAMDDGIRIAAYRAVYSKPGLDRYALLAVPPIHIIVKGGHIALIGVVATEMDKNLAGIAAKGVPKSFSVTNDLRVEGK